MASISLTLRTVKGSELTWDELDANFVALKKYTDDNAYVPKQAEPYLSPVSQPNNTDLVYDKLVIRECLTFNDAQLAAASQITSSFSTVFNAWYRFSHNNTGNYPALASELNGWAYNTATDTINSTINSTTYIGFVSSDKYEYYRHEAILSSTVTDDDLISVVLAFTIDGSGNEHTLSLVRTAGGVATGTGGCAIIYNYLQANQIILKSATSTVFTNPGGSGWNSRKCKVLCVRNGNDFAIASTQIGDEAGAYALTLSFSLTDNAALSVFTGPQSFGYGSMSQQNSSYSGIKFTPIVGSIYDMANNRVLSLDMTTGAFVVDATKTTDEIPRGRLIFAPNLNQLFYRTPTGAFELTGSVALNAYDLHGYFAGSPSATSTILRVLVTRQFTLQTNFNKCLAVSDTAPTATTTFSILRNANVIGSITFSANSTVGVYSASAALTVNVGDIIQVKGPSVANAALTNIMVSLYGILN